MSLDFDGVDDFVDHGDIAGVDLAANFTCMLWLQSDAANAGEGIAGKQNLGFLYTPGANGDRIAAGQSGVWERVTGAGTYIAGPPAHWTFAFDGNLPAADRAAIYKDGVNQALTGTNASATLSDEGTLPVEVGGSLNLVAGFVDGRIAFVKMWTATLSAQEVFQEMNSYRPVRTADLVLWAPYDDGTNARDYSGRANHGTVTGALQAAGPPVSYGGEALRWRRGPLKRLWRLT